MEGSQRLVAHSAAIRWQREDGDMRLHVVITTRGSCRESKVARDRGPRGKRDAREQMYLGCHCTSRGTMSCMQQKARRDPEICCRDHCRSSLVESQTLLMCAAHAGPAKGTGSNGPFTCTEHVTCRSSGRCNMQAPPWPVPAASSYGALSACHAPARFNAASLSRQPGEQVLLSVLIIWL